MDMIKRKMMHFWTDHKVAIALIAVAVDDFITESEKQGISNILSRMELFSNYSEERKKEMLDRLLGIINRFEYSYFK